MSVKILHTKYEIIETIENSAGAILNILNALNWSIQTVHYEDFLLGKIIPTWRKIELNMTKCIEQVFKYGVQVVHGFLKGELVVMVDNRVYL